MGPGGAEVSDLFRSPGWSQTAWPHPPLANCPPSTISPLRPSRHPPLGARWVRQTVSRHPGAHPTAAGWLTSRSLASPSLNCPSDFLPLSCAATPYSSNSNPFADPSSDNPFESQTSFPSSGTAQPSISDREAALNAREAELLRREREVADAGVLIKNWPKCECMEVSRGSVVGTRGG